MQQLVHQTRTPGNMIGSSAISTVQFGAWISQPSNITTKGRKIKTAKEAIHPIFAECAQLTNDPFWADKLNKAAFGKLPVKFTYRDGSLCFRKGAKSISVEVPYAPELAVQVCVDFFRVHGKLFSEKDSEQYQSVYQNKDSLVEEELTWGGSNKGVRSNLLSYFFEAMRVKYFLPDSVMVQLRQVVNTGISGKYFGKDNIHISHSRIVRIDGLVWDQTQQLFTIDPALSPASTKTTTKKGAKPLELSQKDTVPHFTAKWKKHMDNLDRKLTTHARSQKKFIVSHRTLTLNIVGPRTAPASPLTLSTSTPNSPTSADDDYDSDEDEDDDDDEDDDIEE
jgi:hypothetical protein